MSWRPPPHIRALVIAVIWRGDELLVYEGRDSSKGETFYRPLGGGIDFGEAAVDALPREFREEIGTELEGVRYLETIENIYVFEGHPGHELVRVYEARLAARLSTSATAGISRSRMAQAAASFGSGSMTSPTLRSTRTACLLFCGAAREAR